MPTTGQCYGEDRNIIEHLPCTRRCKRTQSRLIAGCDEPFGQRLLSFIYSLNKHLSANYLPGSVSDFRNTKMNEEILVFEKLTS